MKNEFFHHKGNYCVSNGYVFMAGNGADILQICGPVFSMPSVFSLTLTGGLQHTTQRLAHTAVYVTTLYDNEKSVGKMTDFAHPTEPVFIRTFELDRPISFELSTKFFHSNSSAIYDCKVTSLLFEIPEGSVVFSKSRTDCEVWCQLLLPSESELTDSTITIPKGTSHMIFVAGDCGEDRFSSYPNCMNFSESIISEDFEAILSEYTSLWQKKLSNLPFLPNNMGGAEIVENVAVALLSQTSDSGGTIAGLQYHLAYGRDMYGVFRGYMTLGMYHQALACIRFFRNEWLKRGYLPNACGIGMSCSHHHENDGSEQTGYYLLELVEYVTATKDISILTEYIDYALYLIEAQEKLIYKGMLPFNGDETYIAGGMFDRGGIDHGSMEATALYIGSATAFLDLCEENAILDIGYVQERRNAVSKARSCFLSNFCENGRVYINNSERADKSVCPKHRHGVCHSCSSMTWLTRTADLRYLCPKCYGQSTTTVQKQKTSLDCAIWMTVFANCSLLPEDIVVSALKKAIDRAIAIDFGKATDERFVGYEYGVMLYAMTVLGKTEHADMVLEALLKHAQSGGVWAEYDKRGLPDSSSTQYRPWESAINLTAIFTYYNR